MPLSNPYSRRCIMCVAFKFLCRWPSLEVAYKHLKARAVVQQLKGRKPTHLTRSIGGPKCIAAFVACSVAPARNQPDALGSMLKELTLHARHLLYATCYLPTARPAVWDTKSEKSLMLSNTR